MQKLLISISVIASLFLAACSSDPIVNRLPFVYRIDIQQGNVITPEMVNQVRMGMSKRQVQFILGAPMLIDPFHAERWDYVHRYNPGSDGTAPASNQRITLKFEDDRVAQISGTLLPDPKPDTIPSNRQVTVVVPRQELESTGVLTKLWRWIGFGGES
ncbi:Outer membrane beta-barrel assembly protein BamE [hydrothermal vent metagenome]|uniref:Outer membrane beta-barrel assembly protein BamE n=1 Tax=hydrothermal vent metagenome TaxID=652676 RepID=A0A3B0Z1J3_9ZZZZ